MGERGSGAHPRADGHLPRSWRSADVGGRLRIGPWSLRVGAWNLASNARDAMPMGGSMTIRTDDVTIVADPVTPHPELTPGPHVKIAVEDTGTGITPDVLPHVFEPFFTTKDERGVGLGLATCCGIVRQAGGSIQVTSQLGARHTGPTRPTSPRPPPLPEDGRRALTSAGPRPWPLKLG
ncbi:MAG: hypothetical protein IT373_06710 [Polyangiaceae bacterium]|nr:hypothetical protein [Polyangiaceae bacterium]